MVMQEVLKDSINCRNEEYLGVLKLAVVILNQRILRSKMVEMIVMIKKKNDWDC